MPYYSFRSITLEVLVSDGDKSSAARLERELLKRQEVGHVTTSTSVTNSRQWLEKTHFNAIFVDPLSLGLGPAAEFVFQTRERFPKIVFSLYVDQNAVEEQRAQFYHGQRCRFNHYYSLDKTMSDESMSEELEILIRDMQNFLAFNESQNEVQRLIRQAEQASTNSKQESTAKLLDEVRQILGHLKDRPRKNVVAVRPNSVFLSCRFAESDYVTGLSNLLKRNEFSVVTGSSANTYVSSAILERIRECEFFLALMTRSYKKADGTYTTSPWLLEEKGAALAHGKRIVLMVEDGVTDVGGLQGDWQVIHFKPKGFLNAALEAVRQLKSYLGEEQDGTIRMNI